MRRLLADPLLPDGKRTALHFGLGQVLDARGAYAEAAEQMRQANALALAGYRQRGHGYDPANHAEFVDALITATTAGFFERVRGFGVATAEPIFIVGLPRSGTTLTEQILASHSQVHGAGELRLARDDFEALPAALGVDAAPVACLEKLDRATVQRVAESHLERLRKLNAAKPRIADKMPDNYLHLGLIAVLFPKAKFIHCRRDLRDVAVSCWMTDFRQIRWACDPAHIASRFRAYRRFDGAPGRAAAGTGVGGGL